MSRRGWMMFLILGVVWGVPYALIKVAVADVSPLTVAFGRCVIGAALLLPVAIRRQALGCVIRRWRWVVGFALLEVVGPWILLGVAETQVSSSTAALFIAAVPMVVAVLAVLRKEEPIGPIRVAGLVIGFAGVAVLVGLEAPHGRWWAFLALAGTAIGYALGPRLLARRLSDLPSVGVIACSLTVAALVYLPFVSVSDLRRFQVWSGAAVIGLGVVCTAVAFLLLFALISEVGVPRAAVITYLNPVVALVIGVLLFHEPLGPSKLIGLPLVLAGAVLATRAQPSAPPRPKGRGRWTRLTRKPAPGALRAPS